VIAAEARRLAPVDSGTLRDSIGVAATAANGGGLAIGRGGVAVYVGPRGADAFYAHMVEFGTVDMAAHPFMRPAFDNVGREASRVIAETLGREIERAAKG